MENEAIKKDKGTPRLILASGSPRRRELLGMFALPFEVIPARGEERAPEGLSPGETARALALAKAREVAGRAESGAVVIGSDTVVELDGQILGKPRDEEDAFRMLSALSGRAHRVFSGVCVLGGAGELAEFEETAVHFRPLTEREIRAYIATGEPMDKAGAYGYQGLASIFVERIEGDFFNVMGLPMCRLCRLLKEQGVELL